MPNPQVCMFCRYRRTLSQGSGATPCAHGREAAPENAPPVQPRLGPVIAQGRRKTQGSLLRHG